MQFADVGWEGLQAAVDIHFKVGRAYLDTGDLVSASFEFQQGAELS